MNNNFEINTQTRKFINIVNEYLEEIKNRNNIDVEKNRFKDDFGIISYENILYLVFNNNMSIL